MTNPEMNKRKEPKSSGETPGPTGLARTIALASLAGFEPPVAGHYSSPSWLTPKEKAALPAAFRPTERFEKSKA